MTYVEGAQGAAQPTPDLVGMGTRIAMLSIKSEGSREDTDMRLSFGLDAGETSVAQDTAGRVKAKRDEAEAAEGSVDALARDPAADVVGGEFVVALERQRDACLAMEPGPRPGE